MDKDSIREKTLKRAPERQLIQWRAALMWHSVGFATVIVLLWADELFELVFNYYGGDWMSANIQESAIRTVIVIFLWMFSSYKAHQVLSRLAYLESFMHVCAWCKRIEKNDTWLSLEQHVSAETGKKLTHGICPQCAAQMEEEYLTESQD
jgi:hypothetical protein